MNEPKKPRDPSDTPLRARFQIMQPSKWLAVTLEDFGVQDYEEGRETIGLWLTKSVWEKCISKVAALEAKAEKQEASMKSLADEVEAMHPGAISTLWIARRIRVVLDKATASEGES